MEKEVEIKTVFALNFDDLIWDEIKPKVVTI